MQRALEGSLNMNVHLFIISHMFIALLVHLYSAGFGWPLHSIRDPCQNNGWVLHIFPVLCFHHAVDYSLTLEEVPKISTIT